MVGLPTREPRSDADRAEALDLCGTYPSAQDALRAARQLRAWDWVVPAYSPPRPIKGRLLLVAEVYDRASQPTDPPVGQITIPVPAGRRRAAG